MENLLVAVDRLVRETEVIFSRASLSQKLYQLEMTEDFDNRCLNRSLKRLEGQGILKTIRNKGKDYYRLTDKGIRKLADFHLRKSLGLNNQNWDGFWRVVIFDIPEDKKIVRDALRRRLKYFNFYPLQKSVFVTPFSCEKEIEDLANFFQVNKHLYTLLVKSLGPKEKEVSQFFQQTS